MSAITYAVHTATCTYLLDDEGICRWTHASAGVAAAGTERCVGAQFVACLDLGAEGGLVGELRLGGSALFARREGGRFVLLRTLPIERVEVREPPAVEDPPTLEDTPIYDLSPPRPAVPAPLPAFAVMAEQTAQLDPRWLVPVAAPPEELDIEDLLSMSVTEVTLVLPLYRPPPAPPRRGR
jgi:hypothetical protein